MYLCDGLDQTDVGTSGPCGGAVSSSVSQCLAGELIAAWAVGGSVSLLWCSSLCVLTCIMKDVVHYDLENVHPT